MRVVFMGTPEFAVPSLDACAAGHEVVAVYTRPDAASGRGGKLRPSPVKLRALESGLRVLQPATLRDPEVISELRELKPDLIVVAAYGLILPPDVLTVPAEGCVNVHGSLLPRWRGAAPVERAILAGDRITGVSIMRMEEGLDTGAYCVQMSTTVEGKTADQLSNELAILGGRALSSALDLISNHACTWTEQDESEVTYAEKITKTETLLDCALPSSEALRRVRASSRRAPSRVCLDSAPVTVVSAAASGESVPAGTVRVAKAGVLLGFVDGSVLIERLRPEGRGDMNATDWSRGARLHAASTWGSV